MRKNFLSHHGRRSLTVIKKNLNMYGIVLTRPSPGILYMQGCCTCEGCHEEIPFTCANVSQTGLFDTRGFRTGSSDGVVGHPGCFSDGVVVHTGCSSYESVRRAGTSWNVAMT